MVFKKHTPIKFEKEWIRPIKDKLIGVLRDKVWSKWKPTLDRSVVGKVRKEEEISKRLLIDRGILYWSGSMMKVRRPTGARVSKWLKENLDIRDGIVYGGLTGNEIHTAMDMKNRSYERMLGYMQDIGSGGAREVVESVDLSEEIRRVTDRIKKEIIGSIGWNKAKKVVEDEIAWRGIEEDLEARIKEGVGNSGAFEIERFKNEGVRLLEDGSVEKLESWFTNRYAGSVVERRVDIRVESEVKKSEVEALEGFLPVAGFGRYVWVTRRDDRVRPDHARLDGGIFRWDDPPVVDLRSGRRGHPGQDYNCYAKDTEVYTRDGFKLIKDVMIGEEILTLNPNTQDLEWGLCTGKVEKYCKNIVHLHSNVFDLKVDPDHTFFVYENNVPKFVTGIDNLKGNYYFLYAKKNNFKDLTHAQIESMKKEFVEYNDSVYDIEVDRNHTILIKSGKCIHWNSNCRCTASPLED